MLLLIYRITEFNFDVFILSFLLFYLLLIMFYLLLNLFIILLSFHNKINEQICLSRQQ